MRDALRERENSQAARCTSKKHVDNTTNLAVLLLDAFHGVRLPQAQDEGGLSPRHRGLGGEAGRVLFSVWEEERGGGEKEAKKERENVYYLEAPVVELAHAGRVSLVWDEEGGGGKREAKRESITWKPPS